MNPYEKMRRSNAKLRKYLEGRGFLVDFIIHTRFKKDLFNLFDFIALKDGKAYFGQGKSNSMPSKGIYRDFVVKYKQNVMLANIQDRKGVKVKVLYFDYCLGVDDYLLE